MGISDSMKTWISTKLQKSASDHPLATVDSVREVINDIPTGNASKSVIEFGEWLSTAVDTPELTLDERIRAVSMLDEAARPLCSEIDARLIEQTEIKSVQSWFSLANFYNRSAAAYRHCLDELSRNEPSGDDSRNPALLATRAMFAINNKKRLLHLRYRAIEPPVWKDMNWLLLLANSLSILRKVVELYSDHTEPTSVAREYTAGLIYETAPLESLTPRQMNDLYTIVEHHSQWFVFRESRDDSTPYFADLARSISPIRWREGVPTNRTHRYFGVGAAYSRLVTLLKEFERAETLPAWMESIDSEEEQEAFISMMRKVCSHWSAKPPQRRHKRASTRSAMQVTHGFRNVRAMVAGIAKVTSQSGDPILTARMKLERFGFATELSKEMIDQLAVNRAEPKTATPDVDANSHLLGSRDSIEDWILYDKSETGIGGLAPKHPDWLKVGMLIGCREEGTHVWSIGVVRRFGAMTQSQVGVGIELIRTQTICPHLGVLDKAYTNIWDPTYHLGDMTIYGYIDAIYMPETSSLMLQPEVYIAGRRFVLTVNEQRKFIRLTDVIDKGVDYTHTRFEEYDPDDYTAPTEPDRLPIV